MNIMITGASRGVGLELVKYFAGLGNTRVFALTGHEAILIEAMQGWNSSISSRVVPVPFTSKKFLASPQDLLNDMKHHHVDHLDILINNAGLLFHKSFSDMTHEEITQMLQVNTMLPAALIQCLLPWMGNVRDTHIVNIGSMGGYQGSAKFPGLSFYSASKAALACLTECLQEEYKDSRITFNCLALGSVQTEMLQQAFPGYQAKTNPTDMAAFIGNFALTAYPYIKGKIIPVSATTP